MASCVSRNGSLGSAGRRLASGAGPGRRGSGRGPRARFEEYYADLAKLLSDDDERLFEAEFSALQATADASRNAEPLDAITSVAAQDLQLLLDNQLWDAMELMNITWGRDRFREPVARGYRVLDQLTGQVYGSLLQRRGREPRPPFTWDSIGTILQALAEGIGLRHKVDPSADATTPDLYSTAVAAVLAVLTRRPGDQATAHDAIESILETTPPGS